MKNASAFTNRMRIFILLLLSVLLITSWATPHITHAAEPIQRSTISAGGVSSFAIRADGTLWGWGDNCSGQLGNGTRRMSRNAPIKIMEDVLAVSAGLYYAMAIRADNTLWAWGENRFGQLGDGTNINRYYPVKILEDVIYVAAGSDHTLAIQADGSLWTWGSISGFLTPHQIMENVTSVSVGSRHAVAIQADNSLWTWGSNDSGQLGDGSPMQHEDGRFVYRNTPTKIMEDVIAVSAGNALTMAIRKNGDLYAWGSNHFGIIYGPEVWQLLSPVKIMENVGYASVGFGHASAIQTDGSMWIWARGLMDFDWFGRVTTIDKQTPIRLMDDVVAVSSGGQRFLSHTLALMSDGSLWGIGSCEVGQLGARRVFEYPYDEMFIPKKIMDNVLLPYGATTDKTLSPPTFLPKSVTAYPTMATVLVNGQNYEFHAYNIEGRNFFKLRDIAYALEETNATFNIAWDDNSDAVNINPYSSYVPIGGEMTTRSEGATVATLSTTAVFIDYWFEILFTVYRIGDNDFFMLRELSESLGLFLVDWNAETSTISITT